MPFVLAGSFISFSVAAWFTARFCDPASKFHILDHPNARSLHTNPTPRSGGIAIVAGIAAGFGLAVWKFAWPVEMPSLAASLVIVALVSYMDDRAGVRVAYRFAAHILAAGLLVWSGLILPSLPLPAALMLPATWVMAILSLIFIVWMINLYNFMDGMDGFAGGMAVVGFGTFAVLGWLSGHTAFMAVSLITASASAGFLLFNFPPARIFMGDVGSAFLGLQAAVLSLWGARDGVFPLWAALLVFSPFIVDASVTLVRRLLNGERIWEAHRAHYYQRLVQLGWGHRKTLLWEYALMALCALSAIGGVRLDERGQWTMLVVWFALYLFLGMLVATLEKRRVRENAI